MSMLRRKLAKDPEFRVGQILLHHGWITREQLEAAEKKRGKKQYLGDFLVETGIISPCQLDQALAEQKFRRGQMSAIEYTRARLAMTHS